MVRQLRRGDGTNGLILANGGVLTYQHVVCLSSRPRQDGRPYPPIDPLPPVVTDIPVPSIALQAQGECTVEVGQKRHMHAPLKLIVQTYTVEYNRDGSPLRGHVVGRLASNDHRFLANHANEQTLEQLASWSKEPIGRKGWVRTCEKSGRNFFSFDQVARL